MNEKPMNLHWVRMKKDVKITRLADVCGLTVEEYLEREQEPWRFTFFQATEIARVLHIPELESIDWMNGRKKCPMTKEEFAATLMRDRQFRCALKGKIEPKKSF